jgi:hypothetical protein
MKIYRKKNCLEIGYPLAVLFSFFIILHRKFIGALSLAYAFAFVLCVEFFYFKSAFFARAHYIF